MTALKVLYLPLWYPTPGIDPSCGIFTRERARAAMLYNDVTVLYMYSSFMKGNRKLFTTDDRREDGIRTIRLSIGFSKIPLLSFFFRLWFFFRVWRKLIREGWRPDIIDAHVYSAALPAILLRRIHKIPVIVTEHSGTFELRQLNFLQRMTARFVMRRAEMVLPVSEGMKKAIKEYIGIRNNIQVVPNVVNTSVFVHDTYSASKRNGTKKLLSVSLLTEKKGISYLLQALSLIKAGRHDFLLDFVGDGPDKEHFQNLAQRLGLEGLVKFHGWKELEEVAEFMKKCDFFVLPSLHESFGSVYIEAMACGKPVIACNSGGTTEIIDEEVGLLVRPGDVEDLKKAIEYMMDNHQIYNAAKIILHASENFSYEAVGKKLDLIYRQAAFRR